MLKLHEINIFIFQMKVEVSFSSLNQRANNHVTETVKINRMRGGCHMLTAVSEVVTTEPSTYHSWICKPTATQPSVFLFGPASLRSNRAVIYNNQVYFYQLIGKKQSSTIL